MEEGGKKAIEHAPVDRAKKVGDKLYSAQAMFEAKQTSSGSNINAERKRKLKDPALQARQQNARPGVIEIAPERLVKRARKNQTHRDKSAGQAAADLTQTDWRAFIQTLLARYEVGGFDCGDYEPCVLKTIGDSCIFSCAAMLKTLGQIVDEHKDAGVEVGLLYDGTFPEYATLLILGVTIKRWDAVSSAWTRSQVPCAFAFAGEELGGKKGGGERASLVQPLAEALSAAYGRMFDVPEDFLIKLTRYVCMDGHPGATLGILRAFVGSNFDDQIDQNNRFIRDKIDAFLSGQSQQLQELTES